MKKDKGIPKPVVEYAELELGKLTPSDNNPRQISNDRQHQLQKSLDTYGDVGIIVVDENNVIISGHQRYSILLTEYGKKHKVSIKRISGLTESQKIVLAFDLNYIYGNYEEDLALDLIKQIEEQDLSYLMTDIDLSGLMPSEEEASEKDKKEQEETIGAAYMIISAPIEVLEEIKEQYKDRLISCELMENNG